MSNDLNLCLSDYEHQVFVYIRARIHIKNNIAFTVTQSTRAFPPSQLGHLTHEKKSSRTFSPSLSCHVVLKLTAAGYKCPQQLLKMKQKQELQVRFKLASCVSLKPSAATASFSCQQKYRPCTAANLDHEH